MPKHTPKERAKRKKKGGGLKNLKGKKAAPFKKGNKKGGRRKK